MGLLAAASPAAATDTLLYTATVETAVTVSFANRSSSEAPLVRLALVPGNLGTLTSAHWLEFDAAVNYGSPLERTGIVLSTGQSLVVRSSTANVSVVAFGVE